jgi:hypothetical protein
MIRESLRDHAALADAFERCQRYLRDNGVDLAITPATLGRMLTFDPAQERFTHDFAAEANALSRREDRAPYLIPQLV